MKRLHDFWHLLKLYMSKAWLFHVRWHTYCQNLGRRRLLFPLLHKLEPEIDHEHNPEKFRPKDLILIPPHNSKAFISEVLERYKWSFFCFALIVSIFSLVVMKLALIPIAYIISILGNFSFLIYLVLSWLSFMLLFTVHALIKPAGERRSTWQFEYKLTLYGIGRENKIERLITALDQEMDEPDDRVAHFRELSQKRSLELQILIYDLALSDKKVKQLKAAIKKNPEFIREILRTNRDIDNDERESLKELLEPKGVLRDIGVNLVSNVIGAGPGFIVGLILGARK